MGRHAPCTTCLTASNSGKNSRCLICAPSSDTVHGCDFAQEDATTHAPHTDNGLSENVTWQISGAFNRQSPAARYFPLFHFKHAPTLTAGVRIFEILVRYSINRAVDASFMFHAKRWQTEINVCCVLFKNKYVDKTDKNFLWLHYTLFRVVLTEAILF